MSAVSAASSPRELVARARGYQGLVTRSAVLVGLLTVLAAVIRLVGLAHQSYWYDEADTVSILHTSAGGLLARVPTWETTPPLYFMLAWLWAHLLGDGEAGLRSLSALAGILTVPIGFAAGARLVSRRVGLITAGLIACNPLLVWYSQEARSYSLLVLLSSAALLAFVHLRVRPTPRWTVIWAVTASLALATHYYAALTIVPQAIYLLARYRHTRRVRIAVGGLTVWGLLFLVLAMRQLQNLGLSNWINRVVLVHRLEDLPKAFAIGPNAPAAGWLMLGCWILVGTSGWLTLKRANREERAAALFVGRLALVGFAIVFALLAVGIDQMNDRNMLALWLPVALFIAAGFGARRAGAIGVAGAAAVCLVGLGTVIGVEANPRSQRPDWRGVARLVSSPTAHAVFAVNGCQRLPLALYVPGLRFARPSGAAVREVDVIAAAGQRSWWDVLFTGGFVVCSPQTRPPVIPKRLGMFRASAHIATLNQFSVIRFRSAVPVRVTEQTFTAAGLRGAFMLAPRS
ncbi:MAG: glycosyltransferase family 39 protein [Actinomycetota bacterium]|nr:glycosyltransferase family 39 protein [Actinomycetota bacterium]